MNAEFNAERLVRELCGKLNLEVYDSFRAGSFDFRAGWKPTVENMLTAMRGCGVQIFTIRNDHGMLDVRLVANPESELTVCRAILVYQHWASITCENCGAKGRKMVLGGKVQIVCPGCMDKNNE